MLLATDASRLAALACGDRFGMHRPPSYVDFRDEPEEALGCLIDDRHPAPKPWRPAAGSEPAARPKWASLSAAGAIAGHAPDLVETCDPAAVGLEGAPPRRARCSTQSGRKRPVRVLRRPPWGRNKGRCRGG